MNKRYEEMDLNERSKYILDTMKFISFYKEDGNWYADVPEHTKEENEMVAGADVFLDILATGDKSVGMYVSDKIYPKAKFVLKRITHDTAGGTYQILDSHSDAPGLSTAAHDLGVENERMWLCNVMHTFFGEHPEYISII